MCKLSKEAPEGYIDPISQPKFLYKSHFPILLQSKSILIPSKRSFHSAKFQPPCLKSHFPLQKLGESQFLFYPFKPLNKVCFIGRKRLKTFAACLHKHVFERELNPQTSKVYRSQLKLRREREACSKPTIHRFHGPHKSSVQLAVQRVEEKYYSNSFFFSLMIQIAGIVTTVLFIRQIQKQINLSNNPPSGASQENGTDGQITDYL